MTRHTAVRLFCIALAAVTLCAAVPAHADFIKDREAAMKLYWADKSEEALAAFLKMAGESTTDLQKADALDMAVRTCLRLKQPEQALTHAKAIPIAEMSKVAQARVLSNQRQWQQSLDLLKDEDLGKWSPAASAEAYDLRARAQMRLENYSAAADDYSHAVDLAQEQNAKAGALLGLGNAKRALNDAEGALEAYRRVHPATTNMARRADAAIAAAEILLSQGKPQDAVNELGQVDPAKVSVPSLRAELLLARGKALRAQGQTDQAKATYQQVLDIPGLSDSLKRTAQTALQEMQAK